MARPEITEARLAGLPRWARIEIERLRQNEEHYMAKLSAGPEDSDTFADPYSEARRPLGKGELIEFGTERGQRLRVRYLGNGVIDVSADETMYVRPRSSNGVEIVARDRHA